MPAPSTPPSWTSVPGQEWNGHRYWLAATDYEAATYDARGSKNPHIYHSDDGFNWEWPTGLANPNSWPAVHSPPRRAVVRLRHRAGPRPSDRQAVVLLAPSRRVCPPGERLWRSWSANGSSWSTPALAAYFTRARRAMSHPPSLEQRAAHGRRGSPAASSSGCTASPASTAWTDVGLTTGNGAPWHGSVIRVGEIWHMIGSGPGTGTSIWTATSRNGLV